MKVEIHLYLDPLSDDTKKFKRQITDVLVRVEDHIFASIINKNAGVIGNTTLLDLEDSKILATIDIQADRNRRSKNEQ